MRSTPVFFALLSAVLFNFGCAAANPVPAPKPVAPTAEELALEALPFNLDGVPDGWAFAGPGLMAVFQRPDRQAQVQFSFFPTVTSTPAEFIRKVAEQVSGNPFTKFGAAVCNPGGTDCSARINMSQDGERSGWLVVRTFPGRSIYGVALIGLWPVEFEEELAPDFEHFKRAMRL